MEGELLNLHEQKTGSVSFTYVSRFVFETTTVVSIFV